MIKRLVAAVAAVGVFGGLAGAAASGFRVNLTPSMPEGLWRIERTDVVTRGDVVTVCIPEAAGRLGMERGYLGAGMCPGGSEMLLKPVVAVFGDTVEVARDGVSVNGQALPNTGLLTADSAGRPLFGEPPGAFQVRVGEVWVVSSYVANSWDSRYFGAVPIGSIQGRAAPVWVW